MGVDRIDFDGIDNGWAGVAQRQADVDAGLVVGTGAEQPIIPGAVPFLALLTEDFAIEVEGALGVVGADFEVDWTRHELSAPV